MLRNFEAIITKLNISSQGRGIVENKAAGLLDKLMGFSTYFAFQLSVEIYSAAESVSRTLQSASLHAQSAASLISMFQSYLTTMRSDDNFDKFYKSCIELGMNKHGCESPELSMHCTR